MIKIYLPINRMFLSVDPRTQHFDSLAYGRASSSAADAVIGGEPAGRARVYVYLDLLFIIRVLRPDVLAKWPYDLPGSNSCRKANPKESRDALPILTKVERDLNAGFSNTCHVRM